MMLVLSSPSAFSDEKSSPAPRANVWATASPSPETTLVVTGRVLRQNGSEEVGEVGVSEGWAGLATSMRIRSPRAGRDGHWIIRRRRAVAERVVDEVAGESRPSAAGSMRAVRPALIPRIDGRHRRA